MLIIKANVWYSFLCLSSLSCYGTGTLVMKMCGAVEEYLHVFVTSDRDAGK